MNDRSAGPAKGLAVISTVAVVALLGLIVYVVARNSDADPESLTTSTTEPAATQPSPSGPAATPVGDEAPELTEVQKQAAADARFSLSIEPDSRIGLIDGLTRHHPAHYSEADATIAVDSLGVDWDLQARMRAENYIEQDAYSKPGLIERLQSVDFTSEQAIGAVEALDVDWAAQPERSVREYVSHASPSRSLLLYYMTEQQGFTEAEATEAIDAVDIDFNKQAAEAAEKWLKREPDLTCDQLIDRLSGKSGDGFTDEEATYGAGTTAPCIGS